MAAVQRALVSTYDKEGIVPFCSALRDLGIEIVSSGGTARMLTDAGLPVVRVSDVTGVPEMLGGRVKTLHPRIHGGILAIRSDGSHVADLERHGIAPIDLVVVSLYPFEAAAARPGSTLADAIEMIDVGGPAMVRAAAKNFADVGVVVDRADYDEVLTELRRDRTLSDGLRRRLAAKAFQTTSGYDAAIARHLSTDGAGTAGEAQRDGDELVLRWSRVQGLRYGENPHQTASFYREVPPTGPGLASAEQLGGKELSFNNILDGDAALALAVELGPGGCAIVKHGNPCGAAIGDSPESAFRAALECDPVSAFGGVIAFHDPIGAGAAAAIAEAFYEAVLAPDFDESGRQVLARKKNLRVLRLGSLEGLRRSGRDLRRVSGGLLVQDWDAPAEEMAAARVVTRRAPDERQRRALAFAWTVVKHVKSNAIVYAREDRTLGIGAGQMSRVDSARLGVEKARSSLAGAVMASDAFFPFRDGIDVAAAAGISAVVQPGGSVRDEEIVAAADEHGMAMLVTGRRHFRH